MIAGECEDVNKSTVEEWQNTGLKHISEKYEPSDIYNANGTEWFWQMLPENSLEFVGKKAHGSKQPKIFSITLLVGVS